MGFKRPQVRLLSLGPTKNRRKWLYCLIFDGFVFGEMSFWCLFGVYLGRNIPKETSKNESRRQYPHTSRSSFTHLPVILGYPSRPRTDTRLPQTPVSGRGHKGIHTCRWARFRRKDRWTSMRGQRGPSPVLNAALPVYHPVKFPSCSRLPFPVSL